MYIIDTIECVLWIWILMTFLEENYLKIESTEYKHVLIRLTLYRANAKRIFSFII